MNAPDLSPGAIEESIRRGLDYAMDERLVPHYERHLVEDCGYRTPDEVATEVARFVEKRGPRTGARLRWLDLGAGTGLVGKAALRRGIDVDWVAVDVSEAMLRTIECPAYVDRVLADVRRGLPLGDGVFDGVTAAGLFEHVTDVRAALDHVRRVLGPSAPFVFTFPPNRAGRTEIWDADEGLVSHDPVSMRGVLSEAGLEVTHESSYPAYRSGSRGWVTHHIQCGLATSIRKSARSVKGTA